MFKNDVVVVGGCGHVGLPLGVAFAGSGLRVALYDTNPSAVVKVNDGIAPFSEAGLSELLQKVRTSGKIEATTDPAVVSTTEFVVVVIGTPVDEHLNPDADVVPRAIKDFADYLVDGQALVLRSTVYPGVTAMVEKLIATTGKSIDVAFCPERIAEGKALEELSSLPQLVAARTEQAREHAAKLFRNLTDDLVYLIPEEAELAKLFTNVYRYIKFSIANQFYTIANDYGVDFERVRHAITYNYPRAADMPGAGFAAGPCLFKDTMQLAAFNNNQFVLGHAAMMVNEGLPLYLVSQLEQLYDLSQMKVGILGMAFKGESDDIRSSLSYKLKRILKFKAAAVLCADPYVTEDQDLMPEEKVIAEADLIIIGAPHKRYEAIRIDVPVVDVTNSRGNGVLVGPFRHADALELPGHQARSGSKVRA